jgi:hypothetical protein
LYDLVSIKTRINALLQRMKNLIVKLNIYNSRSTDEHVQKNELISTRVYFIALIICLVAFEVYISLEQQPKTTFIHNPARFQFEQLKNESVNDLQCPCSDISIEYSEFISLHPTYH